MTAAKLEMKNSSSNNESTLISCSFTCYEVKQINIDYF